MHPLLLAGWLLVALATAGDLGHQEGHQPLLSRLLREAIDMLEPDLEFTTESRE